jgi:hypothetical protein
MSSNGSVNYLSGVLYYYNTTLTVGAHSYYFNASNGFFTNQTATVSNSPFVNRPPSLSALVTPSLGSSADLFNFTTTYTDADADQPLSIGIVLDGAPKGLQRMGSDYVSGVLYYYNATGLTKGQHSFYFNATDGNYTVSSAAGTGPRIFETAPSCDGASVAEDDWNVNVYSNCTNTAVLPTSSRAGRLLVSGANTLNLTDSQVFLNNSMMQLDGLLLLRQSGLTFVR